MIKIITNERNSNLKKRLQELISNSKEVKIIVAYCNYPGIKELYETLKKLYNKDGLSREHIKILVGLYDTKDKFIRDFTNSVIKSIKIALKNQELDGKEIYEQIRLFIKLLEEKIIVIRKTWKPNHSKLYLFKSKEISTPHLFITGSSNLTRAGLVSQDEFNTPIDDDRFKEAENYFDKLWKNAIPFLESDIRRLKKRLENEGLTFLKAFETTSI